MVYKELLEFCKPYFRIVKDYPNQNNQLTINEIKNICPTFSYNKNPILSQNGIWFDKMGNLYIKYITLDKIIIDINTEKITAFGCDDIEVKTFGLFHTCIISNNISDATILETHKYPIRAMLSFEEDYDWVKLNKSFGNYYLSVEKNRLFKERSFKMNAKFFYTKPITSNIEVVQEPNKMIETSGKEKIKNIFVKLDKYNFSRFGGESKFKILCTKNHSISKTDLLGTIASSHESEEDIFEVTEDYEVILPKKHDGLNVKNGKLIIEPQKPNAQKRGWEIWFRHGNKIKEVLIEQEKGGIPTINSVLRIENSSIDCSDKKTYRIGVEARKVMLLDGKEINNSNIEDHSVNILSSPEWVNAEVEYGFNKIELLITPKETNKDKNTKRIGEIILCNDSDKECKVKVVQQPNTLKSSFYEVICGSEYNYTEDTIKNAKIKLNGKITHVYSNGDKFETYINNIDSKYSIKFKAITSDSSLIDGGRIYSENFGNEFLYQPHILTNNFVNSARQSVIFWIEDDVTNERVSDYKEILIEINTSEDKLVNVPLIVELHSDGNELWTKGDYYLDVIESNTKEIISSIKLHEAWLPNGEHIEQLFNGYVTLKNNRNYIVTLREPLNILPVGKLWNSRIPLDVNDEQNIKMIYTINGEIK